jgi:hypothetical protein
MKSDLMGTLRESVKRIRAAQDRIQCRALFEKITKSGRFPWPTERLPGTEESLCCFYKVVKNAFMVRTYFIMRQI